MQLPQGKKLRTQKRRELIQDLFPREKIRFKNEVAQSFIEAFVLQQASEISADHKNVVAMKYGLTVDGKKHSNSEIAEKYIFMMDESNGTTRPHSYRYPHKVKPTTVAMYVRKVISRALYNEHKKQILQFVERVH